MKRKLKGISVIGIIAIIAIVIVAVVIFLGFGGKGIGGGKGNGKGSGTKEATTISVEEVTEEILVTTEELKYIEITVSGNEYIFQNQKYEMDELISTVKKQAESLDVRITDDHSSIKAYKYLTEALSENSIHYIEAK